MVCDENGTIYRINVDHLHAERLLQISASAMYACGSIPTGVRALCILLHLYEPHAVFVDDDQIDRAAALHGGEDPITEPQEMLGANQFAHIAVDMSLVRQCSPAA